MVPYLGYPRNLYYIFSIIFIRIQYFHQLAQQL